jgi:ribosomal-protein-serine acetyltransferase
MFSHIIDSKTHLKLNDLKYAKDIFELIQISRDYLREWLPWVDTNASVKDTESFIRSTLQGYANRTSLNTVIFYEGNIAGVAGFNEIDWSNRIAYIGYWLGQPYQGTGIMTKVCKALTDYAFHELDLNKVDIRAAEMNIRSRKIPERLNFKQEGTIRSAEWINDHYVDHVVYGMLKNEWKEN